MSELLSPEPLISIIIPAYNSGKYLETMLESIYSQTYQNYEVIVAYDTKSTDNTLEILERYAEKYSLIILRAKDESCGQARNRGLSSAKGDYVIFLDSDDIIVPTYLSDLMDVYRTYPDLNVVCGGKLDAQESTVDEIYNKALKTDTDIRVYDNTTAIQMWIRGEVFPLTPWAWLVKRDYILENNITFPNYSLGEDQVYVIQLLISTVKIGCNRKIGYIYITHPMSLSHVPLSPIQLWNSGVCIREDISKHLIATYPQYARDYYNYCEGRFVFSLTLYSYSKFKSILCEYDIKKLYVPPVLSMYSLGCMCFDTSKFLFHWLLNLKVLRKRIWNLSNNLSDDIDSSSES